jgi:amidase
MHRRDLLYTAAIGGANALVGPLIAEPASPVSAPIADVFAWMEATLPKLAAAMKAGKLTSASLTRQYLGRINRLDKAGPEIRAVIEVNPDAMAIAESLDAELKAKGPRGPLHGLPILIKDNIATHDKMMTTAGSLALVGSTPPGDASVVKKLREAGAVVLGKTNLSEWANFRSGMSTSGWSGRGGLTKNPCCLDRNPSGSSSGWRRESPRIFVPSRLEPRRMDRSSPPPGSAESWGSSQRLGW